MKKSIIAVMMSVFMSVMSLLVQADVLSPDWKDASIDELLAAQIEIGNQISVLRAAEYETLDSIELSGSGTDILSNVTMMKVGITNQHSWILF